MDIIHPPDWARLPGYSHGIAARGRTIYLAGQVGVPGRLGWQPDNADGISCDFVEQFRQVLENIVALLAEAGAGPGHLVKLTWFITDKEVYIASLKALGTVYRDIVGRHFPAMSVIEVRGLVQPGAMVEIEATAVVPD
ncbi:MAG TPA: RidA family protein [Alphaproteobacteria bacterium]|nr:RidA family protein [Alphaproteobacteria bacterium]